MTEIIDHPDYGKIIYTENEWTGKKSLTIDGVEAKKVTKKTYTVNDMTVTLNGSFFLGATLLIGDDVIVLIPKSKWYEIVLAIIPIIFILVWSNVPALVEIFPIVGGAIGGLIGGIALAFSMLAMKRVKDPKKKILIGLGWIVLSILAAYLVAILIIVLL